MKFFFFFFFADEDEWDGGRGRRRRGLLHSFSLLFFFFLVSPFRLNDDAHVVRVVQGERPREQQVCMYAML